MKKPKLTPWFDGHVKPARVGVYERVKDWGVTHYSKWNGLQWCMYCSTPYRANQEDRSSELQYIPWRGLAEQPK